MGFFFKQRFLWGIIFGLGLALSATHVFAANNAVVITWQASQSYVPPGYVDKALPNSTSLITASVEVFSHGTLADIKSNTVYWYLDGNLLGGGIGAQSITFSPFGGDVGSEDLQVQIPDYPGGLLINTVSISILQPRVIIGAPFPGNVFSENPLIVTAFPYFFNTTSSDNLGFSWSVNGIAGTNTEDPKNLQIKLPQGTPSGSNFYISATITNSTDLMSAIGNQNLVYEPLP
jgi:hypothetical protein